jgi:hypothetical protein
MGTYVAWLPDGKSLLFRKGPSNARETFRISVEGGTPVNYGAEWTSAPSTIHPDGRQVAFPAGERKIEIWAMENFLPTLTAVKESSGGHQSSKSVHDTPPSTIYPGDRFWRRPDSAASVTRPRTVRRANSYSRVNAINHGAAIHHEDTLHNHVRYAL